MIPHRRNAVALLAFAALCASLALTAPRTARADTYEWTREPITRYGACPAVAVDAVVGTNIVFKDQTYGSHGLMFGWHFGLCGWGFEDVERVLMTSYDFGTLPAIAMDSGHNVGVAYLRLLTNGTRELWFARGQYYNTLSSHSWRLVRVATGVIGDRYSVRFDSNKVAHLAWSASDRVWYATATFDPAFNTLTVSTPVAVSAVTLPRAGDFGVSIAVDGTNNPAIAFEYDTGVRPQSLSHLSFARRIGGVWTPDASQSIASGGSGCSLALDAAGNPHISFQGPYLNGRNELRYATTTNGTTWTNIAVPGVYSTEYTSLALSSGGLARISYWNWDLVANTYQPMLASEFLASNWQTLTVDTPQASGYYPWGTSLALDFDGSPVIGYQHLGTVAVTRGIPGGIPDIVPPANISDFHVDTGKTSAVPQWTATGDDGSVGTAMAYDLRYSQSPIVDDVTFNAATKVTSLGCPQPAGTAECASIMGLTKCRPYYFALKVRDNAGNYAAMITAPGSTKCSGFDIACGLGGASARPAPEQDAITTNVLELAIASRNPTSDPATLRLAVPAASAGGRFDVSVFDAVGRRVRSLASGVAEAGVHTITWDLLDTAGSPAGRGVYFVRMTVGAQTITRSLIVLK